MSIHDFLSSISGKIKLNGAYENGVFFQDSWVMGNFFNSLDFAAITNSNNDNIAWGFHKKQAKKSSRE